AWNAAWPYALAGMRATSQRALIWVLSIAAVLVPAAGIAYLGAVSYRDERGAVAARLEAQRAAAERLVDRVHAELARALERSSPSPLARLAFVIGADGRVIAPAADPLGKDAAGDPS